MITMKRYRCRAQIRRFTWNVTSPNFGKYFIEMIEGGVSRNPDEFFATEEAAIAYLTDRGYK